MSERRGREAAYHDGRKLKENCKTNQKQVHDTATHSGICRFITLWAEVFFVTEWEWE